MEVFQHTVLATIVAMIASIATAIYAFIAYRTLSEMKKQRENIYRPELMTVTTKFAVVKKKEFGREKIIGIEEVPEDIESQKLIQYKIPLCNVGLGTAKDIKVTLDFPYQKVVEIIKNLHKESNKETEKELSWKEIGNNNFEFITEYGRRIYLNLMQAKDYDYLIPINQEKTNVYIDIPSPINDLFFCFCSASIKNSGYDQFPNLFLKVEYSDIADKKHIKKIRLKFNPQTIIFSTEESIESVQGYISSTSDDSKE